MPSAPKSLNAVSVDEAVFRFSRQLEDAIRVAIIEGIQDGLSKADLAGAGQLSTSPALGRPVGGKACAVPHCGRVAVSKGLCMNHYGKARRLHFQDDVLTAAQLQRLAADGRAQRRAAPQG